MWHRRSVSACSFQKGNIGTISYAESLCCIVGGDGGVEEVVVAKGVYTECLGWAAELSVKV